MTTKPGADWVELKPTGTPKMYHCAPDWQWARPQLPDYLLWCVWKGNGLLQVNHLKIPLHAGTSLLLQPGDAVSGHNAPDNPLVVFACHFWPGKADGTLDQARISGTLLSAEVGDPAFWFRESGRAAEDWEMAGGRTRRLALAVAWLLVHRILAGSSQATESDAALRLRQVVAEICRRPEAPWSVEELARWCGWSRAQLTRQFHALTGEAPRSFVIRQRLALATYYLKETPLPIGRIAELLGYRDLFYFSRQFKRQLGIAPLAFRQQKGREGL